MSRHKISRRQFIKLILAGSVAAAGWPLLGREMFPDFLGEPVFAARIPHYQANLRSYIAKGLKELGVTRKEISGKKILLKPNLVEPHAGIGHINTHPRLVYAAAEAFLALGAGSVIVAEGSGHRRDALLILEESGFSEIIRDRRIQFVDLNNAPVAVVKNRGTYSQLQTLVLPRVILESDLIVSMAKMKTHHWTGATLAMKNLFGIMPGRYYGWPKNVLHHYGITRCILDINITVRPRMAIVDGIVGMEGDGPIMGTPVKAEVVVMGRNLPAVDATCMRIMGIDPEKIAYLKFMPQALGPIRENSIEQRGELIRSVRHDFKLLENIPAHRNIHWQSQT